MTQHTPGPWRAVIRANQKGIRGVAVDMPPQGCWKPLGDILTETDAANARLIAAAPELLESLKDLLGDAPLIDAHTCECRFCGRDYSGEEAPLDLNECAEGTVDDGACPGMVARAAIAKATGGAQ